MALSHGRKTVRVSRLAAFALKAFATAALACGQLLISNPSIFAGAGDFGYYDGGLDQQRARLREFDRHVFQSEDGALRWSVETFPESLRVSAWVYDESGSARRYDFQCQPDADECAIDPSSLSENGLRSITLIAPAKTGQSPRMSLNFVHASDPLKQRRVKLRVVQGSRLAR